MKIPKHAGLYVMLSDCKNLEESRPEGGESKLDTEYDTRPTACRNFQVGSWDCVTARARFDSAWTVTKRLTTCNATNPSGYRTGARSTDGMDAEERHMSSRNIYR